MARYRKIDPRIWSDHKFSSLSRDAKLVFLFFLTHPNMTPLGAMRASLPGLSSELGWKERKFRQAFNEIFVRGMVQHDKKASFIWLPNFIKYNQPESPNAIKAWGKFMDFLPECVLREQALEVIKAFVAALPLAFVEAIPEAILKSTPKTTL